MSVNYTSLKNLVADFLARDDISTVAMNTFIDVVEADLIASFQPRGLDDYVELPITEDGYVILPDDYRLSRVVSVDGYGPLQQIDPQSFFSSPDSIYITTIGDKMYFGKGITGKTCKMLYSKRIPSLSKAESNVISELYPSLYIYGCLKEAAAYIDDKAKVEMYQQKYLEALEAAQIDADTDRYSGSKLVFDSGTTLVGGQ